MRILKNNEYILKINSKDLIGYHKNEVIIEKYWKDPGSEDRDTIFFTNNQEAKIAYGKIIDALNNNKDSVNL